jgi:hypothetical protein
MRLSAMLLALDTSNSVGGPTLHHLKQAAIRRGRFVDAPMSELASLTGGDIFIAQRADQLRAAFSAFVNQFDAGTSDLPATRRRRGGVAHNRRETEKPEATIKARRGYAR